MVHKIQLKDGAKPRIVATRRIPVALRDKVKAALDELEAKGIIEKVNEPTEWINGLVTVQKPDGSVRLCLDPVFLNKYIQRQHYPF
ncbi:uncharacterized protein B4U80_05359, partial [Leptotrombidium deliense]